MYCYVCDSNRIKSLFTKTTNPAFRYSKKDIKDYQINQCLDCGFIFTEPRPTAKELLKFYEGQSVFFIGSGDKQMEKYLQNKLPYQQKYLPRLQKLEKLTSGRSLLEIGSAGGLFLDAAKARGWKVSGLEPSTWGVKVAKEKLGIPTVLGTIEDTPLKSNTYDAIGFYDVVEHLRQPNDAFAYANRVLRSGGILAITLPNGGSLWTKVGKKRWSMFSLPEHLNYFSPSTMKTILDKHDFEIVQIKSVSGEGYYSFYTMLSYFLPEPADLPAHGGVNDNLVLQPESKTKVLVKQLIGAVMVPILKVIDIMGWGQGLEIYARKK